MWVCVAQASAYKSASDSGIELFYFDVMKCETREDVFVVMMRHPHQKLLFECISKLNSFNKFNNYVMTIKYAMIFYSVCLINLHLHWKLERNQNPYSNVNGKMTTTSTVFSSSVNCKIFCLDLCVTHMKSTPSIQFTNEQINKVFTIRNTVFCAHRKVE